MTLPTLLQAQQTPAEKISEVRKLNAKMAEQGSEISTLSKYVAMLRNLAGDAQTAPTTQAATQPAKNLTADEKLKFALPKVIFDNAPLSESLDWLKDAARLNLVIDWKTLEATGITKKTPVNCKLTSIPVSKALQTILSQVSVETRLVYIVDNATVRVSTLEEFAKHPITRVFDISTLLPRNTNLAASQADLMHTIQANVDPASWKDVGGSGTISMSGKNMTVTQSPLIMPMVESCIKQLEASDPDRAIQACRTAILQQTRQIESLRSEISRLAARCRAAGKEVPPEPVPLEKALDQVLPDVKFDQTPFETCINALRNAGKPNVNIFVNWRALQDAGIDKSKPITLNASHLTLRTVVTKVLAAAGGDLLDSVIDEGALTISTRSDLDRNTMTRVYDVRDIVLASGNPQKALQDLVAGIQKNCATDTWRDNGGTIGSIRETNGQLIITQSSRIHRLIDAYLETLRQVKKR